MWKILRKVKIYIIHNQIILKWVCHVIYQTRHSVIRISNTEEYVVEFFGCILMKHCVECVVCFYLKGGQS